MKALGLCIPMLAFCAHGAPASQIYSLVQGIDKFEGSASAWHVLETNGFAVSDPSYDQIFDPYLDTSLPPFITADSAWETYQTLLAAGGKKFKAQNQPDSNFFSSLTRGKIHGDAPLSGVDFFVASPELRSVAATRALRDTAGDAVEKSVENLNYPPTSNPLAAEADRVLGTLQKPPATQLPPALRSEAWADAQLWTQLGGWIEQSLPNQAQPGSAGNYESAEEGPKTGAVAPYPDFFSGLAKLSRETEAAMEVAGVDERFDSKAVARKLLEGIFVQQSMSAENGDQTAGNATDRIQFDQFAGHYMETHNAGGGENSPAAEKMLKNLEAVARRGVAGDAAIGEDMAILQSFFDERMTAPRLLRDFVRTCEKLAELARKETEGTPLSESDEKWMGGYGASLARYHAFPRIYPGGGENNPGPSMQAGTNQLGAIRLGTNQLGKGVLWAGLGRPETLYIILPVSGRLRLFRGAVLSYREQYRVLSGDSDEKREPIPSRDLPPPVFTSSFRTEKSAGEMLETLVAPPNGGQVDRDVQETLDLLQSRVANADLPALIRALGTANSTRLGSPVAEGIAMAIAKLNWAPFQKELLELIDKEDGVYAGNVASILQRRPEWIDSGLLTANFEGRTARSRRVYAFLLGLVPPTERARSVMLGALHDEEPGVRWQAAIALGKAPWDAPQKIPPLLDRLSDTNELVVAAAARSLGQIGAADVASVLFSNLEQRLAGPAAKPSALQEQHAGVQDLLLGVDAGQTSPFDPDNLLGRARLGRMRRFGGETRREQFSAISALIEALGDLKYPPALDTLLGLLDGRNATAAAKALKKLAPEKLGERLISIAANKNAPAQGRDDALLLLTENGVASPMPSLIPLLDDQTLVPGQRVLPGREWRICDHAATILAGLMGRTIRMDPSIPVEQRDSQIAQVRQWLKSAD